MGNVLDSTDQPNSSVASTASAGNNSKISDRRGMPGTSGFLKNVIVLKKLNFEILKLNKSKVNN